MLCIDPRFQHCQFGRLGASECLPRGRRIGSSGVSNAGQVSPLCRRSLHILFISSPTTGVRCSSLPGRSWSPSGGRNGLLQWRMNPTSDPHAPLRPIEQNYARQNVYDRASVVVSAVFSLANEAHLNTVCSAAPARLLVLAVAMTFKACPAGRCPCCTVYPRPSRYMWFVRFLLPSIVGPSRDPFICVTFSQVWQDGATGSRSRQQF